MTPLRQRLIEALTLKGYSPKTHEAYVSAVAALARYFGRSPDRICNEEVRAYLLHLHNERKLAASSINVALSGLRFFYTKVLDRSIAEVERSLPRPGKPKAVCAGLQSRGDQGAAEQGLHAVQAPGFFNDGLWRRLASE
jgi:site-specific recombinase XerD